MSGEDLILAIRDRVIDDGIAEVEEVYDEDDPKRDGAIIGFELCRALETRKEYEAVIRARENRERKMRGPSPTERDIASYWHHRYGTLQVEWVYKCLVAAGWANEGEMVSGRALMKVHGVVQALAHAE